MIPAIKKPIPEIRNRDPITQRIIASAYKVHSELEPGFNERIYHNALKLELKRSGMFCEKEKQFRVTYQATLIGVLKIDLVVAEKVIVEVKAVTGFMPKLFESQILSYLKITGRKAGLLINFGNKSCEIKRLML